MTKEEIIKIIIIGLIGAFSKSLFDNLLGKYIPDKKKLNSYIIKFLLFSFRYVLPTYFLIISFFNSDPIDKYFVFKISIFTTVLFFNIIIDLLQKQRNHFDRVLTIVERLSNDNEGLKDITSDHLKTTSKLADNVRILADNLVDLKNNKP
jgi:hypothetical protein